MKLELSLARQLARLLAGETIPHSRIKKQSDLFVESGALVIRLSGRTKKVVILKNEEALLNQLSNQFGISDLNRYIELLESPEAFRSDSVIAASDSKIAAVRTFSGFLVNVVEPLKCLLEGTETTLLPTSGLFYFINNPDRFQIPETCIVVGVENPESFRFPPDIPHQGPMVFVSRYPQNQSKDLIKWLLKNRVRYLHVGDFDFAGIRIYLAEFKKHLGEQATFYVPEGLESLFRMYRTPFRYDQQIHMAPKPDQLTEPGLIFTVELINRFKAGLDQEVLSGNGNQLYNRS